MEKRKPMVIWALAYAKRGYPVVPLHGVRDGRCGCGSLSCRSAGKHPVAALVPHGLQDATTNPTRIRKWWAQCPDANIGIVAGAASGLVVLDIDDRHGGSASLAELEREFGPLPATVTVETGNGRHLWFRHPGGQVGNRAGLRPGVDVRGDGGYVVAPPSRHVNGRAYTFIAGGSR